MTGVEDARSILERVVEQSIAVKRCMLLECATDVQRIAELITAALRAGNKVLICGNGGSAADAQHVAGEFVGRFLIERRPLPVLALTPDSSVMTCIGNDYGYDQVFARQVAALAMPGDVVVGISTSGNSPNVLRAVEVAREFGAATIGFTGQTGGKLKASTTLCLCVPSTVTARIQEAHITAWHAICEAVDIALFATTTTA
jgi:D-sedoheptulose 7-phosphate isomerase